MNYQVIAKSIDSSNIRFECPFCWDKYNKNGEPSKRAKRRIHIHGSGGIMENHQTTRMPHCGTGRFPKGYREFEIAITDDTERIK